MNKVKTVLVFALLLALPLSAIAQSKVTARSAKKAPTWFGGAQSEYIITSAIADDLERAKEMCMDNVRKQIIAAVAMNVKESTTSSTEQQVGVGNEIAKFLDSFSSSSSTQSANLPFLKGISPSKIEEFYWEKNENKKTGSVNYTYSIKYPLPSGELKRMVRDFENRDKEMVAQLNALEEQIDQISSTEQIDVAISKLSPIIEYFFDDVRKNAAKSLSARYQKLLNNISFRIVDHSLGKAGYVLLLNNKPITTSLKPILRAKCASQIAVNLVDGVYNLTYNYSDCLETEENYIEVLYRFGDKQVASRVDFDVRSDKMQITAEGKIYLSAGAKTDSTLSQINIRMTVESKYLNGFTVKNIILHVPTISEPLIIDNVALSFTNAGTHVIDVNYAGTVRRSVAAAYKLDFIRGTLEVVNQVTNKIVRVPVNLPYSTSW